ncbi:hypothetical protein AB0K14_30080 [Actinosynnema sp. NPDC050801]|uniref:hypothetical protein n=1 Tax=unclassified Actinosynnema TaxID=2637065 RepID=UPI0033EE3F44
MLVLIGAVPAVVFAASVGAGYSMTETELSDAQVNMHHGDGVVVVNTESERVEGEARGLTTGDQELELVRLADGRVASVNRTTGQVTVLNEDMSTQHTSVGTAAAPDRRPDDVPVVVAAASAAYLVRPADDVVELIKTDGTPQAPVAVPGATPIAVGDGEAGLWVLTDDGTVAHVVRGAVKDVVRAPAPIRHLTLADGRPIGITEAGEALDVAASPLKSVSREPVPHGSTVVVPSPKGAGRYLLVLDRRGRLVSVDPRTGQRHEFDVPKGVEHNLGAPVVLDGRAYVPDYEQHELRSFDLGTGTAAASVAVPGTSPKFTVEVQDRRVVANDRADRRTVAMDPDGRQSVIDKGQAPGVDTDTENPDPRSSSQPPSTSTTPSTSMTPPPPAPPTASRTTTTAPPTAPQVTVPPIPPGTARQQACDAVDAVGLVCQAVEVGPGGATGTVRDTQPRGGTRVPEGSTVVVNVYGENARVPDVIGRRLAAACDSVNTTVARPGTDACAEQPMTAAGPNWPSLGVVAEQSPAAGGHVALGTEVSVRYWDFVPMPDLRGGTHAGDAACNAIIAETANQVPCQVVQGSEGGGPAGTVESSTPVPGQPVRIGQPVVLTVFRQAAPSPTVDPMVGMTWQAACDAVRAKGWVCDARPDGVHHQAVVAAHEPAAGTLHPVGSVVVVHYSLYESAPLHRFHSNDRSRKVYLIRFAGTVEAGYTQGEYLGHAYRVGGIEGGTAHVVRDFMCTESDAACGGAAPNHYFTLDDDTQKPKWSLLREVGLTLKPVSGQCGSGQVMIYRYLVREASREWYTVDHAGEAPGGTVFTESLGCVWRVG